MTCLGSARIAEAVDWQTLAQHPGLALLVTVVEALEQAEQYDRFLCPVYITAKTVTPTVNAIRPAQTPLPFHPDPSTAPTKHSVSGERSSEKLPTL